MKCLFFDESEDLNNSDTFVMCGVMVDADRVAESADVLNSMFAGIYAKHEISVSEFKASDFFRGDRGWQKITLSDKFEIIRQICCVVKSENIKIIGTAISQVETNKQMRRIRRISGVKMNTWLTAGILMCASVQHEMAASEKDVGNCLIVADDCTQVPSLNKVLHNDRPLFDKIYARRRSQSTTEETQSSGANDQFDRIVNKTVLRIKSDYSPHVQVADILCYIFRNHIENINGENPAMCDERRNFHKEIFELMDSHLVKHGKFSTSESGALFRRIIKRGWKV